MKKILFVIYNLNNGGAERALVNLFSEMDPAKYSIDVMLFAKEGMFLSQLPSYVNVLDGGNVLDTLYSQQPKRNIKNLPVTIYKYVATAASKLTEKGTQTQCASRWLKWYSRIVPNNSKLYDIAVAYISRDIMYYVQDKVRADKKIVFVHNDYRAAGHPKKYDKKYLDKMDKIVTISDTCTEVLQEEFPELIHKIVNLPNIVSTVAVRKRADEAYPEEFQGVNRPIIATVGRLNVQKGLDWAVEAASVLKKKGIQFQWYVLGEGELRSALEKQIKECDVADCFELLGARENPYMYMKNCDIIAQTSRWEGKSVVLDEAKIIGTPILTTDYPTAKDQILAGKEGIVVEMTPKAIAEGIEQLLLNKGLREDIHNYLVSHEYGNAEEIQRYYELFE